MTEFSNDPNAPGDFLTQLTQYRNQLCTARVKTLVQSSEGISSSRDELFVDRKQREKGSGRSFVEKQYASGIQHEIIIHLDLLTNILRT